MEVIPVTVELCPPLAGSAKKTITISIPAGITAPQFLDRLAADGFLGGYRRQDVFALVAGEDNEAALATRPLRPGQVVSVLLTPQGG